MQAGTLDILRTFKNPGLVVFMAWSDVRARYKRSILGPLWISLSTMIGVVGLGFVWSELFNLERRVYVPMLTVGLILWQLISGSIIEATSVFTRQAGLIRNLDLPLSLHPAQLVVKQLINFAHNIPLFFLVVLILGSPLNILSLLAIPAMILLAFNLFWIVLLLAILGARFRDLEYLVATVMPLLMFFSPVMYRSNALHITGKYIWLNPLAHMIELVRYPLLGEMPPDFVIASNLLLLLVGGGLTMLLFNGKRNRIALWI